MTDKTFEEQFPSLVNQECVKVNDIQDTGRWINCYAEGLIQNYCFDKHKIRDSIIKFRDNIFETGEMSKEDRAKLTIKFDILFDELGL